MAGFELDPEIQQFIDDYLKVSNSLSTASSVEQQRVSYEAICQHYGYPCPADVVSSDGLTTGRHGNIGLRRYRSSSQAPADTQIVFLHGGGFILGSLDSHDDICAELCSVTGFDTVSIDYRLSPEFPHPVHLDDCVDAFEANYRPNSIVVGISAGATLAAALCHRLKTNNKKPAGQVLVYPALGGELFDLESYVSNAEAPLLTTADMHFYDSLRCQDGIIPLDDPEFFPLQAKDFSGIAATIAISADIDPLRDDAKLYVDKLKQAGVYASWINEPGLVHDYLRARHVSRRAGESFNRICASITRLATVNS